MSDALISPIDNSIRDEAILLRRVHPDLFVQDSSDGKHRLSSSVFQNDKGTLSLSVIIKDRTGLTIDQILSGDYKDYGMASFTAKFARENNQGIMHTPIQEYFGHGDLIGDKGTRKNKTIRYKFIKHCKFERAPIIR
ncbi:MAG TPA: hypothetical protein VGB30_05195 [bacterium]|jgi:hypothetical protein